MEEPALSTGTSRAQRDESLVFTLKDGFEFGEMVRRTRTATAYQLSRRHSCAMQI
jgi:hypothetical protein